MEGQRKEYAAALWLPALLAAGILLITYACKGMYPFGLSSIAQTDMPTQYVQFFTHFQDALRGEKALFFDWYAGGNGMAQVLSAYSILSPLNLLFLLIPRSGMLAFQNLSLLIKISLIALSGGWYFRKRFPGLSLFYVVFFALCNALSGYALVQSFNIMWLDIVILIPMILYYAEQLLRGGGCCPSRCGWAYR